MSNPWFPRRSDSSGSGNCLKRGQTGDRSSQPAGSAFSEVVHDGAMHYVDRTTGELVFEFARATARKVTLVVGLGGDKLVRQPMEKLANVWRARVKLPSGWCLYAFEVDGRVQPDRAVGQLRTKDGQRCSLAVVPAGLTQLLRPQTA
jgi:hypothetical protein